MLLDVISTLGGMILPPAVDFIKKKFLDKGSDTPTATISSLATTKPEVMPAYVESLAKLWDSKFKYFNRDVIGSPSQWVVNLRSSIRPITVPISLIMIFCSAMFNFQLDPSVKIIAETCVGEWFGSRLL